MSDFNQNPSENDPIVGEVDKAVAAIARRVFREQMNTAGASKKEVMEFVRAAVAAQVEPTEVAPAGNRNPHHVDVTLPPYNADPTGVADARKPIQDAIDAVSAAGGGTVFIPAGEYKVTDPYIELKGFVQVVGAGMNQTQIIAQPSTNVSADKTGVFHTGTWNKKVTDPNRLRFGVSNLWIRGRKGGKHHQQPIPNLCGVLFNTYLGEGPADPDCVATLNFVEVWGMETGIAILGLDDQAMKCHGLKVRQSLQAGLVVGKPIGHPEGGGGAADNKFFGADIGGSNISNGDFAGIEVYTSQTKFIGSTSWYTHSGATFNGLYGLPSGAVKGDDNKPYAPKEPVNRNAQKNGAGWYIAATKCTFSACEAQENGGHGFVIRYGDNCLSACRSESSSYRGTQHGSAGAESSADFYVCNEGAKNTIINSCTAAKARPSEGGARWGFYVEGWVNNLDISHCTTVNIPTPAGATHPVHLGTTAGDNVYVQVDKFVKNTRPAA